VSGVPVFLQGTLALVMVTAARGYVDWASSGSNVYVFRLVIRLTHAILENSAARGLVRAVVVTVFILGTLALLILSAARGYATTFRTCIQVELAFHSTIFKRQQRLLPPPRFHARDSSTIISSAT